MVAPAEEPLSSTSRSFSGKSYSESMHGLSSICEIYLEFIWELLFLTAAISDFTSLFALFLYKTPNLGDSNRANKEK